MTELNSKCCLVMDMASTSVNNDEMDFDAFYQAERVSLLRLCYLATLDAEAAADATQEAMLRAFGRWEALSHEHPVVRGVRRSSR